MKVTVENSKVNEFEQEIEMLLNCNFDEVLLNVSEGDWRTTFELDTQSEEEEAHIEIIIEELESK